MYYYNQLVRYSFFLIALIILGCNKDDQASPISTMSRHSFLSESLNDSLIYRVYRPASYHKNDTLPVLYLLHGHGGNDSTWLKSSEGNIQSVLDSLISHEFLPPLLAVIPNAGNSWYVDSHQKMESAFINDLLPHVENQFSQNRVDNYRVIAGISAGGYGTLRFTLKYPELFKSALLLSPAAYYPEPPPNSSSRKINVFSTDSLFDNQIWQSYAHVNLINTYNQSEFHPKFYISTGDDDEYGIVEVSVQLRSLFIEYNIPHELTIINGGHDWTVWSNRFCHDLTKAFAKYDTKSH